MSTVGHSNGNSVYIRYTLGDVLPGEKLETNAIKMERLESKQRRSTQTTGREPSGEGRGGLNSGGVAKGPWSSAVGFGGTYYKDPAGQVLAYNIYLNDNLVDL